MLPSFRVLDPAPMNPEQGGQFVDHWFEAVGECLHWDREMVTQRVRGLHDLLNNQSFLASRPPCSSL